MSVKPGPATAASPAPSSSPTAAPCPWTTGWWLGALAPAGNTPLSTLIVSSDGVINKRGDGFIVGDGTFCNGQVFVNGQRRDECDGRLEWDRQWEGGEGWLTLQDNAVYNIAGSDWNIGDYGSGSGPRSDQGQRHAECFAVLGRQDRHLLGRGDSRPAAPSSAPRAATNGASAVKIAPPTAFTASMN